MTTIRSLSACFLCLACVACTAAPPPPPPDVYSIVLDQIRQNKSVRTGVDPIPRQNLPADVQPEQVKSYFGMMRLGTVVFLAATQPNSNTPMTISPEAIRWAGVLATTDEGKTWIPFFTIKNATEENRLIRPNVMGIFTDSQKLYVDVVDDRGAGSGEGLVTRFSSADGGRNWTRSGCLYFVPEEYYPNYKTTYDHEADRSDIQPFSLKQAENCL